MSEYRFLTIWQLEAPLAAVCQAIEDSLAWPECLRQVQNDELARQRQQRNQQNRLHRLHATERELLGKTKTGTHFEDSNGMGSQRNLGILKLDCLQAAGFRPACRTVRAQPGILRSAVWLAGRTSRLQERLHLP